MRPLATHMVRFVGTLAVLTVPAARAQDASTPEEIELTIGADGMTIVREVRSAQLTAGEVALRVLDVSPQLLPETVTIRALSSPDALELREQTAWFEVLDTARALERLAGRPVELLRYHDSTIEQLEGRLLFPPIVAGPKGDLRLPLYLEAPDGKIRLLDDAEIQLDALPSGDWNRMRLDWKLQCRRADRYRFELLYTTRGFAWHVDDQLRIAADGATADWSALATIDNQTGIAFPNARVSIQDDEARLYPVADATTLERKATLQIVLAQQRDAPVKVTPTWIVPDEPESAPSPVRRRFELTAVASARSLPAAIGRVIVLDSRNRPLVAGTRLAEATPAGQARWLLGDPLPGVVGRCQIHQAMRDGGATERHYDVTLTSTREEPIEVEVVLPLHEGERVEGATLAAVPWAARHVCLRTTVTRAAAASLSFVIVTP